MCRFKYNFRKLIVVRPNSFSGKFILVNKNNDENIHENLFVKIPASGKIINL